jgi:hypothetical protein
MTTSRIETLKVSTPSQEGVLHASKWQHLRMLVSVCEFQALLERLGACYFVNVAKVCKVEESFVTKEKLLELYEQYLKALKEEKAFEDHSYKQQFSLALSSDLTPFYLMQVREEEVLVKLKTPAIRMQLFNFHYIEEENKFVFTQYRQESIPWGLEFSFPQFYQDPDTCQPVEILKDKQHPNTQLFKLIQQWMRDFTSPTAFMIHQNKQVAPFRLGKKCLMWINEYPSLRKQGLQVWDHHAHRSDHNRN